jgi:hypothetical protein
MARKSNAQELHFGRQMVVGLGENYERLSKRGLTKEFIKKMETTLEATQKAENEQEALKAKVKEKTAEFETQMAALLKQIGEAKKVIKLELPQEIWKEFGIEDQR